MRKPRHLTINDIYVLKQHRNQNIGKSLYEKAEEYARENIISLIRLHVWAFNRLAIDFYHELGFQDFIVLIKVAGGCHYGNRPHQGPGRFRDRGNKHAG